MRVKLILLATLVAVIIGAGVPMFIAVLTLGSFLRISDPQFERRSNGWLSILLTLPPLIAAFLACIFIYRHTARRRKLQAALTLILVLLLSFGAHIAVLLLRF